MKSEPKPTANKLPKTQAALLAAIRAGEVVLNFGGAYYRASDGRGCTAAAKGLVDKGLADLTTYDEMTLRLVPVRTPGEVAQ